MKFHDKNVSQSTLDRLFIAVNVEVGEDQGDNPDGALIRFEFIEILVRIAQEKFLKPGICKTLSEGLEMLIERHIIPENRASEWQGFRDELIWNLECNDVLACNLEGIMKVFNLYTRGYLKHSPFEDV